MKHLIFFQALVEQIVIGIVLDEIIGQVQILGDTVIFDPSAVVGIAVFQLVPM
jgi:hypothetical protein